MTETLQENPTTMAQPSNQTSNSIEEHVNQNPTSLVEPFEKISICNVKPPQQTQFTIVVPSKEKNPSPMDKPSQDYPTDTVQPSKQTTKTFSFEVHPASTLKEAIVSLSDADFNPQGLGMIEVGETGLDIRVRNTQSGVVGHLWLKATSLINFECSNSMKNKMVNLNDILQNLADAAPKDTITIHHFDESTELSFQFGNAPSKTFAVELFKSDADYENIPNISYVSEGIVICEHLRQMIQAYRKLEKPRIVSVDISEEIMKINVGKFEQTYNYKRDKVSGTRGMEPGQKHNAWFQFPHCESLYKASFLTPGFLLCFVHDPPEHIMMRFNLRELGDLVYYHKATLIIFNSNDHFSEITVEMGHLATAASLL